MEGGIVDKSPLLESSFDTAAQNAMCELHYGRLEWLAYHIREANFCIHPMVAKKLLTLLEGGEANCYFELRAVRRSDLPPALQDPQLIEFRNFDMAIEVARLCKFKRGHILRACEIVGKPRGLKAAYVRNCIKPFRERALEGIKEEEMQAAYDRGEIDILGRPISE